MPPNHKRRKLGPSIEKMNPESNNISGILLALRYLSREAEGAGLTELAKTLEEAELKCDQYIEYAKNHFAA